MKSETKHPRKSESRIVLDRDYPSKTVWEIEQALDKVRECLVGWEHAADRREAGESRSDAPSQSEHQDFTDERLAQWAAYGVGGVDAGGLACRLAGALLSSHDETKRLKIALEDLAEAECVRDTYPQQYRDGRCHHCIAARALGRKT